MHPGLDTGFDKHHGAYKRIFARLGMSAVDVQASSGAMGGSESIEFIQRSDAGERTGLLPVISCDYRANLEKATSALTDVEDGESDQVGAFCYARSTNDQGSGRGFP